MKQPRNRVDIKLIPIRETIEENEEFVNHPDCLETIYMSIDFYKRIGYHPPWIGYYAEKDDQLVGSAGFKGRPVDSKVEVAYGTFERYRHQGIGTQMCRLLVELSLATDPSVIITARTLPEMNYSARILEKNSFVLLGTVIDPEDGEVWEWKYQPKEKTNALT